MVLPSIFKYNIEERARLIDTIRGRRKADLVVSNVNIVSTPTGEILEDKAIIVSGRRIAGIVDSRNAERYIGEQTIWIDAGGAYAAPGFIDPHIHIESSLLTPRGFAKTVLPHGTTSIVADPHEIANVLGRRGLELFIEESKNLPLKILIDIPSCVPATDPKYGLETTGSTLDAEDIGYLADLEGTYGLGEVMDFVSVTNASRNILEKLRIAHEKGLVINGHAPLLMGEMLDAYIDASIWSDHESTSVEESLEKLRKGMYVFIRQGSAWRDLPALSKLLLEYDVDCRLCGFASDDVNVMELFEKGHMDRIINEAIMLGIDPVKAIQLATIGPAMRLHLEDHIGVLGPARLADIVLTPSLEKIKADTVIANGAVTARNGGLVAEIPEPDIPGFAKKTVNIKKIPEPVELVPKAPVRSGRVKVNVVGVQLGSALTKWLIEELDVVDGYIKADPLRDIVYAAVLDRHKATGSIGKGFIQGLGFKAGAIAQTIAHDTHNLIVAGNRPEDMVLAIRRIVELQGGIVIADKGEIIAELPLPVAGLMSDEEPVKVYNTYKGLIGRVREEYGLEFESFFMNLALVALPVIPELRITDKGLVDVARARLVPLIAE